METSRSRGVAKCNDRPQRGAAMTASAFPDRSVKDLGFFVEADAEPAPPGGLPRGGVTRTALSNRHLEYAVTWYGIALTLVGVYLAFAISRLRAISTA